jgi:hypothetical protein
MVFSKKKDHAQHVRRAISLLNKWNLKLNIDKSHFGYTRMRLLGHVLSGDSRAPDPDKIKEINDFPRPQNVGQLHAFLGMTNFLRDYIPCYSALAAPLEAQRGGRKNKELLHWTMEAEKSFRSFKLILARAPVLRMPVDGHPFFIQTDASNFGAGAVLGQKIDGQIRYIRFISKSFNSAQRVYSATRRELLAIIIALKHFRPYIYATRFELQTDHKALTYMFTQKKLNSMLLSWLDVLLDYDFSVTHMPGILFTLPDALSRLYPDPLRSATTLRRFRVRAVGQAPSKSGVEKENFDFLKFDESKVYPERELKSFVKERFDKQCPEDLGTREQLLKMYHLKGHFGADILFKLVWHAGFFWPGLRQQCHALVSQCDHCFRYNLGKVGYSPIKSIQAKYPFDHVAVDLLSLHKTSPRGHNYILIVVDICTRFVILRPLKDKSALSVARSFWEISSDFGVPKIIQSDNGTEFVNEVIEQLTKLMGVDHRTVACYNPRANGAAERHVQTVLSCLRKMCRGNTSNFDLYLPSVQSSINSKPARLHGNTPAELFFGRPVNDFLDYSDVEADLLDDKKLMERIALMMDLVYPSVFERSQKSHALSAKRANKRTRAKPSIYPVGSKVMIRDVVRSSKNDPFWVGPYTVLKVTRAGTYTLMDTTGSLLARTVPKHQVKFVAAPEQPELAVAVVAQQDKAFVVDKIVAHRGQEGSREYLTRWKGYSSARDTWEPESHFDDHRVIQVYWDSLS